jgi:hypothetical protein
MSERQGTMASREDRRRKILMGDPTQHRIILGFCVAPLLSLIVACLLVGVFSRRVAQEAMLAEAELPSLRWLFLSLCAFVVVAAGVTLYQAVKHSHRIAGPLYRMRQDLGEVASGNRQKRIKLREGDYLTELADDINRTLDAVAAPAVDAASSRVSGVP